LTFDGMTMFYNPDTHVINIWHQQLWSLPVIFFGLRFAFFTHISGGKNAQFQNVCAKKRNDFRQLKGNNFRVKICKTEENLLKFLNNMAYTTVTYMRDCVTKRNFIYNILIKCICFIIKINHVWSSVRNIALKTHCFPKNALFSNMCTFYPIVLKRKIITGHCKTTNCISSLKWLRITLIREI